MLQSLSSVLESSNGAVGLSSGTAYDLVEALYEIYEFGADDPSPTTYTPADVADEDSNLLEKSTDE